MQKSESLKYVESMCYINGTLTFLNVKEAVTIPNVQETVKAY